MRGGDEEEIDDEEDISDEQKKEYIHMIRTKTRNVARIKLMMELTLRNPKGSERLRVQATEVPRVHMPMRQLPE